MKNYTQVYVKNSFEAAETYCKAFGAEITREFKNEDNTAYEHCELSVNGEGFLALAEAKNPCDINVVHKYKWETMTFNVFEMGTEEAVYNAFNVYENSCQHRSANHQRCNVLIITCRSPEADPDCRFAPKPPSPPSPRIALMLYLPYF